MDPLLTIPFGAVVALCALEPGVVDLAQLDACCRTVGLRPELDLEMLTATLGPVRAEVLVEYWHEARRLHSRRLRGAASGNSVVVLRRPIGVWRQETGRPKRDLVEQYEALTHLGDGSALTVADLLDVHPDGERIVELVSVDLDLPTALGGPAHCGEQRRVLRITARYSPWRDRRLRRLTLVEAFADEVWPEPDAELVARWRAV